MSTPPQKQPGKPGGNRRRRQEIQQIQRALQDQGPADADTLKRLVGATYWEAGRFDKALSWGIQKRLLVRQEDGRYSAP